MEWPVTYERRVRYSDTDAQRIVFNANYLVYWDDAITDLFALAELSPDATHALGYDVVTAHVGIDFRATASIGDTLVTGVRIDEIGRSSVRFGVRTWVRDTDVTTAEGIVIYVTVAPTTHKKMPVPDSFIAAMEAVHGGPLSRR